MSIDTYGGIGAGVSRRGVIGALGALSTIVFANPARAVAHACRMIVDADEGPFYPTVPIWEQEDLTYTQVGRERAAGEQIVMFGRVVGPQCVPVAGARVEVWQADSRGQYVHPRAPVKTPIDPNFRYFGATRTDPNGFYRFRTIRPAPYVVFGLKRAPHIHVRVRSTGHDVMTSEMYFAGAADDERRSEDQIYRGRGPRRAEMIIAGRTAVDIAGERGVYVEGVDRYFEYELSLRAAR